MEFHGALLQLRPVGLPQEGQGGEGGVGDHNPSHRELGGHAGRGMAGTSDAAPTGQVLDHLVSKSLSKVFFFLTASSTYNSHTIQFTSLRCTIQWFQYIHRVV